MYDFSLVSLYCNFKTVYTTLYYSKLLNLINRPLDVLNYKNTQVLYSNYTLCVGDVSCFVFLYNNMCFLLDFDSYKEKESSLKIIFQSQITLSPINMTSSRSCIISYFF